MNLLHDRRPRVLLETFRIVHVHFPANMRRWPNVGLLLGQRRRRWANSKPTLGQRRMSAGFSLKRSVLMAWDARGRISTNENIDHTATDVIAVAQWD